MNATLATFILARPFGFVTADDMPELLRLDSSALLLVRCGRGRFVCPAMDLEAKIEAVDASGDYVRDVSFTATTCDEARRAINTPRPVAFVPAFCEADCGSVFDGVGTVYSDADPGL